jgi:hypothetical protein
MHSESSTRGDQELGSHLSLTATGSPYAKKAHVLCRHVKGFLLADALKQA